MNTIEIAGIRYLLVEEAVEEAQTKCVLIRSADSGVHFGVLRQKKDAEVTLVNSRRVWHWAGACSLSQMAVEGVTKPHECKFSMAVPEITILGVCEIIPLTTEAKNNLYGVPEWKT